MYVCMYVSCGSGFIFLKDLNCAFIIASESKLQATFFRIDNQNT